MREVAVTVTTARTTGENGDRKRAERTIRREGASSTVEVVTTDRRTRVLVDVDAVGEVAFSVYRDGQMIRNGSVGIEHPVSGAVHEGCGGALELERAKGGGFDIHCSRCGYDIEDKPEYIAAPARG